LEIISLGGLVPGLSLDAAMLGASQPRNEKLANLFYRMKLIEAYGTGISKIISCYKGKGVQPKFKNVEGAFCVILPNIHANQVDLNDERYMQIIKLFQNQKEIERVDVENVLNTGTTSALNILKEMANKEIIVKKGKGKATRYFLK
jgi:ATP-dependent DNA helicase RecG